MGKNWSDREIIHNPSTSTPISGLETVSPNVIKQGDNYKMYYVALGTTDRQNLFYISKNNDLAGNDLSNPINCNLELVDGIKEPFHFSIAYDTVTSIYHMIGFEGAGIAPYGSIQYWTSTDGVKFKYKGVALKYEPNNKIGKIAGFYQSCLVKVDNYWTIYATTNIKYYDRWNRTKWNLCCFTGENILELRHIKGNFNLNRPVYYNDILLANKKYDKVNKPTTPFRYLTFESEDGIEKFGYGMDYETNYPFPKWTNGNDTSFLSITTVTDSTTDPIGQPRYNGCLWCNKTTGRVFIGVNNDWIPVMSAINKGSVVNKSTLDTPSANILDVADKYRCIISSVGASSEITNITGGVDGQEVIIYNKSGAPITIKNYANSNEGFIFLKGGINKIINNREAIKLHKYVGLWIEI